MQRSSKSQTSPKQRKNRQRLRAQRGAIEISPLALLAGLVLTAGLGGAAVYLFVAAPEPPPPPAPHQKAAASATKSAPAPAPIQALAPRVPSGSAPAPTANALGPNGPAPPPMPRPSNAPPAPPQDSAAPPKAPKIDLKSVEYALWRTKPKKQGNFKGWMRRFEDEINTIYFATLRRRYPKAAPATLMPTPVRVEPKRVNNLLVLRGYIDVNQTPGYQKDKDKLLFVFEQRKPYRRGDRRLSYALYDDTGYYYRPPGYSATIQVDTPPTFVSFFVEPTWQRTYHRRRFVWFHQPRWWATPYHQARVSYYFGAYPTYRVHYRRHYRAYYRPPGWRATFYFRRSWYRHGWRWRHPRRYRGGVHIGGGVRFRGHRGIRVGRWGRWGRRGKWKRRKFKRRKWKRRKWKRRKWKRRKFKRRKWKRRKFRRRGWGRRGGKW